VVEQLLIATAVVGALFTLATGAVVAVVVRRRVRRGYRAVRAQLRAVQVPALGRRGPVRRPGSAALATIRSPGWWLVQNRRHRMWRAVSSAEHAVAVARRSDVAVGDLPVLVSRLRAAARGVDSVLRASAGLGSLSAQDREDCTRIVAAATSIHEAALSSLRSASHTDAGPVVSAVQIEVAALAAGVRASLR
jgi:hypothetical protein